MHRPGKAGTHLHARLDPSPRNKDLAMHPDPTRRATDLYTINIAPLTHMTSLAHMTSPTATAAAADGTVSKIDGTVHGQARFAGGNGRVSSHDDARKVNRRQDRNTHHERLRCRPRRAVCRCRQSETRLRGRNCCVKRCRPSEGDYPNLQTYRKRPSVLQSAGCKFADGQNLSDKPTIVRRITLNPIHLDEVTYSSHVEQAGE